MLFLDRHEQLGVGMLRIAFIQKLQLLKIVLEFFFVLLVLFQMHQLCLVSIVCVSDIVLSNPISGAVLLSLVVFLQVFPFILLMGYLPVYYSDVQYKFAVVCI